MTHNLALRPATELQFTDEQRRMIRDTYAGGTSGASDSEFAVLLEIARARRLNPLLRQIHFVSRWDNEKHRAVWSPQVSIDGLRAIAERTGRYDGQDEPEYVYGDNKTLLACRVRVYRKDWRRPVVGLAFWSEFAQFTKDGSLTRFWREKPLLMLAKVAESLALRKAFPEDISGLYTREEMGDDAGEVVAPKLAEAPRTEVTRTPPKRSDPLALPPPKPTASPASRPVTSPDPDPTAAYRARVASTLTLDELVAVRLANRHRCVTEEQRDAARATTRERAKTFGTIEDFGAAVQRAEGITKEPSHWATVADLLGALEGAPDLAAVDAAVKLHATAFTKLPNALRQKLRHASHNRLQTLRAAAHAAEQTEPDLSVAGQFEVDLNVAADIPALDAVADRIEVSVRAGTLTADEARHLIGRHNSLVTAMEQEVTA